MHYPPGPTTPASLQLFHWITRPLDFMDTHAQRYGDLFTARFGYLPPLVFASHPQAIEQIFTAAPQQFDAGQGSLLLRNTLGDNSLLVLDGERHQRQRQLLMPPFHGERMRAYGELIGQITDQVIDALPLDQVISLRSAMQDISLQVILRAVFGLNPGNRCEQLRQALVAFLDFTTSPMGMAQTFLPFLGQDWGDWSPAHKFALLKQKIDDLIYQEIAERRSHFDPNRPDILNLLLSARDSEGQPMTDVELRDELMTLLLAGHETTATALSWDLYWIYRDANVKTTLEKELAANGPDSAALMRLPYLNAVCSETLRIYPVAMISVPRVSKQPIAIQDYTFEPGALIAACIYLTHRRPDLYPQPQEFRPERFLERQFSPYEFLPFGGGARRCIGAAFAMFEMKLVLAQFIQRCQFELAEPKPVQAIRRGLTLAPKGGIRVILRNRE